jgi:hypothetical protein
MTTDLTTLSVSTLTASIAELLTEAYAGPPDPNSTWFIDNAPDSSYPRHPGRHIG